MAQPTLWWMKDPKAIEAVEYLLGIGFNSEDMLHADIEASGDGEPAESDPAPTGAA